MNNNVVPIGVPECSLPRLLDKKDEHDYIRCGVHSKHGEVLHMKHPLFIADLPMYEWHRVKITRRSDYKSFEVDMGFTQSEFHHELLLMMSRDKALFNLVLEKGVTADMIRKAAEIVTDKIIKDREN